MTEPNPQQEYIVTEEQLIKHHGFFSKTGRKKFERKIRSRPYTSASSDKVLEESNPPYLVTYQKSLKHVRKSRWFWNKENIPNYIEKINKKGFWLYNVWCIAELRQQTKEREP
jgi:hypothetical protein